MHSLAASLMIKAHAGDSNFKCATIASIKSFFGCGQTVAARIKEAMTSCDMLFRYKSYNNSVVAVSYKSEITDSLNKAGRLMRHCFVVALDVCKECKLKDIEKQLRKAMMLNAINGVERKNGNKSNVQEQPLFADRNTLTLRKMSNIIGKSRTTARRELKRLEGNEIISITRASLVLVCESANPEALKAEGLLGRKGLIVNPYDNRVYVCAPNQYHILKREVTKSFKNIIYNCARRLTTNDPAGIPVDTFDGYFEVMESGKYC